MPAPNPIDRAISPRLGGTIGVRTGSPVPIPPTSVMGWALTPSGSPRLERGGPTAAHCGSAACYDGPARVDQRRGLPRFPTHRHRHGGPRPARHRLREVARRGRQGGPVLRSSTTRPGNARRSSTSRPPRRSRTGRVRTRHGLRRLRPEPPTLTNRALGAVLHRLAAYHRQTRAPGCAAPPHPRGARGCGGRSWCGLMVGLAGVRRQTRARRGWSVSGALGAVVTVLGPGFWNPRETSAVRAIPAAAMSTTVRSPSVVAFRNAAP